MTEQDSDWVVLGRISGVFGVKGWVKVFSDTDPRSNILDYPRWYLGRGAGRRARRLLQGRAQGKGIVARIEGCDDRDQAAALIGSPISVPREALPAADEGEFYWADLEGLEVRTREGVILGRVDHLFSTGSNDVLVVKGTRQRLLPFIGQVILDVRLDQGVLIVDWDPEF